MKMKILTILFCGVMVLGVTGCSSKKSDVHSFYGKILEVSPNYIIVEPNVDEEERTSSDKFRINMIDPGFSLSVDDFVEITYEGKIDESYPAQIELIEIKKNQNTLAEKNYSKTIENITLEMNIPNEWKYEELPLEDNYKFALKIYRHQDENYFVLYYYNTYFGVCGTGRSEEKLNLNNGTVANIGYYNGGKVWSDISFYDINRNIALINYGTKDNEVFDFIKTINIQSI